MKENITNYKEEQYPEEEVANILTHVIGVLLSVIGISLIIYKIDNQSFTNRIGIGIFCISLLAVYLSSSLYHYVSLSKPWLKNIFRKVDHIAIYFLIAGTHTPFILKFIPAPINYYILMALWGFVVCGIIFKLFFTGKYDNLSLAFYLLLGWSAGCTLPFMLGKMEDVVIIWIVIGGLSYTFGIIFYKWESLKFNHAIWHIFVLFGSISHFISVYALL